MPSLQTDPYTILQAEQDIAQLRSQISLLQEVWNLDTITTAPPSNTFGAAVYAGGSGRLATVAPSGLTGYADLSLVDTTIYTDNNLTGIQPISLAWTIPANDAVAGSTYEIYASGNGTFENQNATWGYQLNGSGSAATVQLSNGYFAAGSSINWWIRTIIVVDPAVANFLVQTHGAVGITGGVVSNSNAMISNEISSAFTASASNTVGLTFQWAAASAGQALSCPRNIFTRRGP